jgi:uncharacterized protein YjgD (DUF1641 family)
MFTLYPDTEKELFFETDYKPIDGLVDKLNITELNGLLENLYNALENAWLYNADLLFIALSDDIITIQKKRLYMYICSLSSGRIASIINNTKYTEIDKAIQATITNLDNIDESILIDMGTGFEQAEKLIRESYQEQRKP